MKPDTLSTPNPWAGRIVTAIPVLMLLASGAMKLMKLPPVMATFSTLGFAESAVTGIGILELACTALYLIPRTSVLGAILLAAYLGGATCSHVRIGEAFIAPVAVGVLVWVGLYLRDERVRALIPLRG